MKTLSTLIEISVGLPPSNLRFSKREMFKMFLFIVNVLTVIASQIKLPSDIKTITKLNV
jgi:hypothetical protein